MLKKSFKLASRFFCPLFLDAVCSLKAKFQDIATITCKIRQNKELILARVVHSASDVDIYSCPDKYYSYYFEEFWTFQFWTKGKTK